MALSAQQKRARKLREQKQLNQQAEDVVGLSPLIGVSRDDIRDAVANMSRHFLRHPLHLIKHLAGYSGKIVDLTAGLEERGVPQGDRRFKDDSWQDSGFYHWVLQAYLALGESMDEWLAELDLDSLDEQKAQFVLSVIKDSLAPTNHLLTNPVALKKFRATRGGSLIQGMRHLMDDMRNNHGMPSQVDKSQFEVGKNLATTEGAVVFRNEVLELIQYSPLTSSVYQRPMLIVPPQINKYYILDLSPEKSLFKFLLQHGHRVFTVSWRNPTAELSSWGMEHYIKALVQAVTAIKAITGQDSINISGACSGGITATILSSYLKQSGDSSINSLSLSVCVLSQAVGDSEITAFASPDSIESARRSSRKHGVLEGKDLSRVFNWMRPNDLVWSYVVNNYLMGSKPPAFDILYWNNDTTCLPAQLHSDFLDILLSDPLATPGALKIHDQGIDLQALDCDKYLVGGTTDHITPWHACYRSTRILGGTVRFILSTSGHVQALVNPPGNPKASYLSNPENPARHEDWLAGAEKQPGSWWLDWHDWLANRSGRKIRASKKLGGKGYAPIEPAPGLYVRG
ncbi:alpha/beta fold hydrolase [Parahaliea maris]|nr:alpha/beta fold hydrolase [Parahaliea maris]